MSVRHAILGVLLERPKHGYQVRKEVERLIGGSRYNGAQIYEGLRRLEKEGFVVACAPVDGQSRDRHPYRATPKGAGEFERWLRAPFKPSRPNRDETMFKMVFLGLRDPPRLMERLERVRRQHLRRLTGPTKAPVTAKILDDGFLFARLSGAVLRFREEAEIRWIDYCLDRLKEREKAAREQGPEGASQHGIVNPNAKERRAN
jgi:DNA-binding PadR family transcriptional regulator